MPNHAPRACAKMLTALMAEERPCVTIRACPHASEEGFLQGALLLQQAAERAGTMPESLCVEAAFDCADKLEKVVAYLQTICSRVALRLTFKSTLTRPLDLVIAPRTEWFALEDTGVGLVGAHVFVHFPSVALTHLRVIADCHVTLLGSEVGRGGVDGRFEAPNARMASAWGLCWGCGRGWGNGCGWACGLGNGCGWGWVRGSGSGTGWAYGRGRLGGDGGGGCARWTTGVRVPNQARSERLRH